MYYLYMILSKSLLSSSISWAPFVHDPQMLIEDYRLYFTGQWRELNKLIYANILAEAYPLYFGFLFSLQSPHSLTPIQCSATPPSVIELSEHAVCLYFMLTLFSFCILSSFGNINCPFMYITTNLRPLLAFITLHFYYHYLGLLCHTTVSLRTSLTSWTQCLSFSHMEGMALITV